MNSSWFVGTWIKLSRWVGCSARSPNVFLLCVLLFVVAGCRKHADDSTPGQPVSSSPADNVIADALVPSIASLPSSSPDEWKAMDNPANEGWTEEAAASEVQQRLAELGFYLIASQADDSIVAETAKPNWPGGLRRPFKQPTSLL